MSLVALAHEESSQAFRFFDLPFELRAKILGMTLETDRIYSLDPENFRAGQKRLNVFLTCRQLHEDAYRVFYSGHTFRIFPTHGRFFGNKILPLLARLPLRYREVLNSLELRLGPGWNSPPTSWKVDERLGLEQMRGVRVLKLFIECDPSLEAFRGFRINTHFYTDFSNHLLEGVLRRLPAVSIVEVDGWPSVPRHGQMIKSLINVAETAGKTVVLLSEMESFEKRKEVYRATARIVPSMNAKAAVQST